MGIAGMRIPNAVCGYCDSHYTQVVRDTLMGAEGMIVIARCDKCGGITHWEFEQTGAKFVENIERE